MNKNQISMKNKYQIRYQHTSWALASSKEAALSAVRLAGGVDRIYYADCPDGLYCYCTAAEKDADDTGASAFAVICGPEQQGAQ
jgi:hypothetical protein